MSDEHNMIYFTDTGNKSTRKLPKHTGKIKAGDPYVYLDKDNCLVWMGSDGPQYLNEDGDAGSEGFDTRIVKRLGKFKGLAIEQSPAP